MRLYFVALAMCCAFFAGAAVTFVGAGDVPVEIKPEASTGLDAVYVLRRTQGVQIQYEASSDASKVLWQRFSNLGGAYAEDVLPQRNGRVLSLALGAGDMGYIIEENGRRNCYWITDYSAHELNLQSISPSAEQSCDRAVLDFDGNAAEIAFYTINGRRTVLSRQLELSYNTLEFDADNFVYRQVVTVQTIASIAERINVPAPLCNTSFVLTGDRFLQAWHAAQSIESPTVTATAVQAASRATQTSVSADNEQKPGNVDGLGGSAPCTVLFEAAATDAAIFTEWQFSRSADFTDIEISYNQPSVEYTFTEQGTTYVRFTANNNDGDCPFDGDVYEVFIGESALDIPNAFSPQASPGVNDLWKVSYKSLVDFECHIFNVWGKELFSTTDPSQGWDGRFGGKYVPAGVYYYVIKATGADGVKYNRAGDINIINYKEGSVGSSSETE